MSHQEKNVVRACGRDRSFTGIIFLRGRLRLSIGSLSIASGMLVTLLFGFPAMGRAEGKSEPKIDFDWTWVETPFGKPVIDRGPVGDWDHSAVDNPYVFVESGRFYCFFEAQDTKVSGWHERIGLAVSLDGVSWSKHRDNPMLDVGPAEAWDGIVAKLPSGVIERAGVYHLFYSGRDNANSKQTNKAIGLATATSLTGPWVKQKENPILSGRRDHWDRHTTTLPAAVFQREENYWLLYRGMKGLYYDQGLGVAVSRDLMSWKPIPQVQNRPLLPTSEEVASIAVAFASGKYVGISQPLKLSDRRYWSSADLITWKKGPVVNFKTSAQAETLSNPFLVDAKWNILYEQGDRIYRAILSP